MSRSLVSRADELAALPLEERLKRRIIDGERKGLEGDLDTALQERPALDLHHPELSAFSSQQYDAEMPLVGGSGRNGR
ncbi:hypothetical protein GCM10009131_37990 [Morganella psychrotolerans]